MRFWFKMQTYLNMRWLVHKLFCELEPPLQGIHSQWSHYSFKGFFVFLLWNNNIKPKPKVTCIVQSIALKLRYCCWQPTLVLPKENKGICFLPLNISGGLYWRCSDRDVFLDLIQSTFCNPLVLRGICKRWP